MLKQTPLNATHRAAHARMVDFAGWDMPVHYGSQVEEHHAVRRDAGMFDVSHMRVLDLVTQELAPQLGAADRHGVAGRGARDFLRFALANNVDKLKTPGKALYSCLLTPDGGVIDDLIVYFLREDWFRIVVNASTAEKDIAWLRSLMREHAPDLELRERGDLAMVAVQGPAARDRVWQVLPSARTATEPLKPFNAAAVDDLFIARTGYTGEDGFEIMVPADRASALWQSLERAGVRPCGLGARDTLRLEAGMNLYGQDMDEKVSPLESGLAWTVDLMSPRDFVGKAALASKPLQRDQVGLVLEDPRGVLRAHQAVHTDHGEGEITSGTFSPTMLRSIALARLPRAVKPGDVVQVVVRDRKLAARVVKPPFVRNGQVLIQGLAKAAT